MNTYVVLYREVGSNPLDAPLGFRCEAEDADHAQEQCENAWPDCDVVWVVETDALNVALDDYYFGDDLDPDRCIGR
jgi:hypothetical protein